MDRKESLNTAIWLPLGKAKENETGETLGSVMDLSCFLDVNMRVVLEGGGRW